MDEGWLLGDADELFVGEVLGLPDGLFVEDVVGLAKVQLAGMRRGGNNCKPFLR
jgi:hypothetical protein